MLFNLMIQHNASTIITDKKGRTPLQTLMHYPDVFTWSNYHEVILAYSRMMHIDADYHLRATDEFDNTLGHMLVNQHKLFKESMLLPMADKFMKMLWQENQAGMNTFDLICKIGHGFPPDNTFGAIYKDQPEDCQEAALRLMYNGVEMSYTYQRLTTAFKEGIAASLKKEKTQLGSLQNLLKRTRNSEVKPVVFEGDAELIEEKEYIIEEYIDFFVAEEHSVGLKCKLTLREWQHLKAHVCKYFDTEECLHIGKKTKASSTFKDIKFTDPLTLKELSGIFVLLRDHLKKGNYVTRKDEILVEYYAHIQAMMAQKINNDNVATLVALTASSEHWGGHILRGKCSDFLRM